MSMTYTTRRAQKAIHLAIALLTALALLATACSSDGSEETTATAATETAKTTAADTEATVAPEPTAVPDPTAVPEPTAVPTPEPTPEPELNFDEVDQFVDSVLTDYGLEGAGLIVVDADGVLHHEHYGSFTPDRVSAVMSVSKMVGAGVLLRLQEEGVLDIDAPLADITEWAADNPDITTAQLLSNSSGLVTDGLYPPYFCQFTGSDLSDCTATILTTPDDDADIAAPDTAFAYGGAQWQVAGGIAEMASGESWAELIQRIYIEPCGLETLGYGDGIMFSDFPAYPAWLDGDAASIPETSNPNMEGGAYGTTGDFGAILQMHVNGGQCPGGQVLTQESLDIMHADRIGEAYGGVTPETGMGYGLGWWQLGNGQISDPGAFGALAWIDTKSGYAAYWVIESSFLTTLSFDTDLRGLIHEAVTGEPMPSS